MRRIIALLRQGSPRDGRDPFPSNRPLNAGLFCRSEKTHLRTVRRRSTQAQRPGWIASPETSALYHVYRSTNGLEGTFTLLTTSGPTYSTTYTDSGQKVYQVRAFNLITTGSDSYTTLSQAGAFATSN
jgi:hypothetical protein